MVNVFVVGLNVFFDSVFIGELVRLIELLNLVVIIFDGIFLFLFVLIKIKLKVWNNEFIDFCIFLSIREELLSVLIFLGVINLY